MDYASNRLIKWVKRILILTTISPPPYVVSVQRTPRLVVTNFGARIVSYPVVKKWETAALAIRRLCRLAFSFCGVHMKVTTKLQRQFNNLQILREAASS